MPGLIPVFRKELADQFSSRRFVILFLLILLAGLSATYVASQSVRDELATQTTSDGFVFLKLFTATTGVLPPYFVFIAFLGPLVGLALGFDAINGEQARGTLSRILAQPIYRDAVINGKWLAGVVTTTAMLAAITLIVGGLGLRLIGVPPTMEESLRLIAFVLLSAVYVSFWLSLAILFSIVFRQTATAALAGMAVWIFATFFVSMIAGLAVDTVSPVSQQSPPEEIIQHEEIRQMAARVSPTTLYSEATATILSPGVRTLGPVLIKQVIGMIPTPLKFGQSLLVVWPQVVGMIALTLICFAISYIKFMRQEIRAG